MQRYIKLYDNVLDKETCEEMINLFDDNKDQQEHHDNEIMNFDQINLIQHDDTWNKYSSILADKFTKVLNQYREDCGIVDKMQFPTEYTYEQFRLKRYEPGQGRFDVHTDVNDLNSAKRFLVFFAYLNSGEDGGTEFPTLGLTTPRKQGAVLVFPPLWTYPHAGLMPQLGPKYIVGSYLHYLEK
jgi:hypothetical protein